MFVRLSPAFLFLTLIPSALQAERIPVPGPNASVEETRRFFTEDPDAPMIVPKAYDVTIVQYLDYACPACRVTVEPLRKVVEKDGKVRVIFRDWPIFGPASSRAAMFAVGSKYQGKYTAFHRALYTVDGPLTDSNIRQAAKRAGVDWQRLEKDIAAHSADIEDLLARNDEQAQMLGLAGTPGFIIGDTQSFGGMTTKQLEAGIVKARAERKNRSAPRGKTL